MNNLPAGLIAGRALHAAALPELIRNAVMVGVDLGSNLSVTGSLATILWLTELRRAGEEVGFFAFLRVGAVVMPAALALSIVSLALGSRY